MRRNISVPDTLAATSVWPPQHEQRMRIADDGFAGVRGEDRMLSPRTACQPRWSVQQAQDAMLSFGARLLQRSDDNDAPSRPLTAVEQLHRSATRSADYLREHFLADLRSELTCPVSLTMFYTPWRLPCGHVIERCCAPLVRDADPSSSDEEEEDGARDSCGLWQYTSLCYLRCESEGSSPRMDVKLLRLSSALRACDRLMGHAMEFPDDNDARTPKLTAAAERGNLDRVRSALGSCGIGWSSLLLDDALPAFQVALAHGRGEAASMIVRHFAGADDRPDRDIRLVFLAALTSLAKVSPHARAYAINPEEGSWFAPSVFDVSDSDGSEPPTSCRVQ